MADSTKYGNPADYDIDLHSIYSAYLGDFDAQGIDWWDASWSGYFGSFNEFLGFGWEVMVVVDSVTGRAHIAARRDQIALFARMIKTRFGETLDKEPPTLLPLTPVQSRTRSLHRLVTITDLASYRKLCGSLYPAELAHLRNRVRYGEPNVVQALFFTGGAGERCELGVRTNGRGYTWACVKTTWWEKGGPPQGVIPGHGRTAMARPGHGGKGLVLEVGLAAVRCANLRAVEVWPPIPDKNYRKAHYITEEWVDKRTNTERPNYPRAFGFGKSQFVAERSIERILDASLGALASQEADNNANTLILLSIGDPQPLPLPANSTLPSNIIQLDVLQLEFAMLQQAQRQGIPGVEDRHQPLTSLHQLLRQLQIPVPAHIPLGNAGNEAFYTVLAFQKLLIGDTRMPERLFAQEYGFPAFPRYPQPVFGVAQPPHYISTPSSPGLRHQKRLSNNSAQIFEQESTRLHGRQANDTQSVALHRQRPLSMINAPSGSSQPLPVFTDGQTASPDSVRRKKESLPRSQTVCWDDADYSSCGSRSTLPGTVPVSSMSPGKDRAGRPPHRPSLTGIPGTTLDGRSKSTGGLPPSSLRNSQQIGPSPSSRSVSFSEEKRPPPSAFTVPNISSLAVQGPHLHFASTTEFGVPTNLNQKPISSNQGLPTSPMSRSVKSTSSANIMRPPVVPSLKRGSKDSADSPRLDSGSASGSALGSVSGSGSSGDSKTFENMIAAASAEGTLKDGSVGERRSMKQSNEKDKERKMRSSSSIRDLPKAFAKFWVG